MAPHAILNGDHHESKKKLTVLVTGFGPFQDRYPINPSYEIAISLPPKLLRTTRDGREIQIIAPRKAVRVAYEEVRELVPILHESFLGTVDLVLHIGMASGRGYYTGERYGHRDGYSKSKDLDGKTLPVDDGLTRFGDCPEVMTTSLDFDSIMKKWNANVMTLPASSPAFAADCRASEDAGHYLCDYIYFNSLAWYGRYNKKLEGGESSDRPVLFLHVPAESDPLSLEKGRQVTIALIEAMADKCSEKNGLI